MRREHQESGSLPVASEAIHDPHDILIRNKNDKLVCKATGSVHQRVRVELLVRVVLIGPTLSPGQDLAGGQYCDWEGSLIAEGPNGDHEVKIGLIISCEEWPSGHARDC
jgi:hypothetical protein